MRLLSSSGIDANTGVLFIMDGFHNATSSTFLLLDNTVQLAGNVLGKMPHVEVMFDSGLIFSNPLCILFMSTSNQSVHNQMIFFDVRQAPLQTHYSLVYIMCCWYVVP